jgi:cystathionine gamma-synthase
LISIDLADARSAEALVEGCALWVFATSLGGVESTLERRRRWKSELGSVPEGLVRLSVGIEHVEDLWSDLAQALDHLGSGQ